jgi:restriction endonuclease S subunit
MKRIRDILSRNKTPVVVEDGTSYKQVTIRTNYKGVVLRGTQDGSTILTKNQFAVSAGQFILSRIDARNGAFGIIPEELEGAIVTNDFLAFDINEDEVEREFFNVFLQSPVFLEACIKASRGNTNRKRVDEDFFLNYEVNLPPLPEQHDLIKQISKGRTKLALAQGEITHQQSLLAKLKQAILQEAIQGKLTADWRAAHPDVEPASQLLHRIQAEKARLIAAKKLRPEKPLPKITPAEIPFEIPKGWEWCRIGDQIKISGGSQPNKGVFIREPREGYTRFIQIRDFKSDDYRTYIPTKLANRMFTKDDILIGRYGPPVFQILRGLEGTYNVALMKAEPRFGGLINDFLFYLLQEPRIQRIVVRESERTAGQTGVRLPLLNEIVFPLPPSPSKPRSWSGWRH